MASVKSERLMNLVICLLVARTFVPKSRIRAVVPGYRDQSDDAFERMFERDKDELRALGVPLQTGSADPLFDDEPGYRIPRREFELPDISLEPDEAAILVLAAGMWQQADLAGATTRALVKMRDAGLATTAVSLPSVEWRIDAAEPAFWTFWEAVRDRQRVRFGYRKPTDPAPIRRQVEPWGVLSWHGRWYVVGRDTERKAPRLFRLSRVERATATGRKGAFEVPSPDEVRGAAASLAPPRAAGSVRVLVRVGAGYGLRRRATGAMPAGDGFDELEIPYADTSGVVAELASYGPSVIVLEPAHVRDRLLDHLSKVASG